MKRLCFVVSSPLTLDAFLRGQLATLAREYLLEAVANCVDEGHLKKQGLEIRLTNVAISRETSVFRDGVALARLAAVLRRMRVDAVHSVTPKAGLLAMVAGKLAGVGTRVHTFTGQVWATRTGIARAGLKVLDRVTAACASHVLVDSQSQLDFLVSENVINLSKATVLHYGSISGVDTTRFRPNAVRRLEIRAQLGIGGSGTLFMFLGRLKKDKGVLDLASAFSMLCARHADVHLALVGPDEEGLGPEIQRRCGGTRGRLHFVDQTNTPEHYMASADVFCLPSYREGFGSVVIEAAACEVPSIASRIYGVTDAVEEGETGILHEPGNVEDIRNCMERLYLDRPLRVRMGRQGRERAKTKFEAEDVTRALVEFYAGVLGQSVGAEEKGGGPC
ncbi:MAG: glycosyltransferase family 4 protein [Bryobacteraceae bacterium]|nr:glycosyltransferase family 4 protein [Bryobacteraceae bacterium]